MNSEKIKNLSPVEIWSFIVGRVLLGFSAGIFGVKYFPDLIENLAWPSLILGLFCFVYAMLGLRHKRSDS